MTPSLAATVAAFVRRDWRLELTYRVPYLFDCLAVLGSVALFYYLARYVEQGESGKKFFTFIVAGLAVLRVNTALARIVQRTESEIAQGAISYLVSSRLRPVVAMVGSGAFEFARAFLLALLLVGLAAAVGGSSIQLNVVGGFAVLIGLAGAVAAFLGLGAGILGVYLILRVGAGLSGLVTIALPLLAGAYFPISRLPEPLHAIATVLPFDDTVEIVRGGLLRNELDGGSLAGLACGLLIVLPLGFLALHMGVCHARRAGTLEVP